MSKSGSTAGADHPWARFKRAAFSNEAGIGSAPIAHSAVKIKHPASEGLVALLEPFIDTVVICTMTALTIVIANPASRGEARKGESIGGVTITSDASDHEVSRWGERIGVSGSRAAGRGSRTPPRRSGHRAQAPLLIWVQPSATSRGCWPADRLTKCSRLPSGRPGGTPR